jgi:hypothetical protein
MLRDNTSKSEDDTDSVQSSSSDHTPTKPDLVIDTSTPIPDFVEDYDEIDSYTNHPLVERAFAECDLNHEGRLKYEEFKMSDHLALSQTSCLTHLSLSPHRWVQRTPGIVAYFESILPFVGMKKDKDRKHLSQKGSLPIAKSVARLLPS